MHFFGRSQIKLGQRQRLANWIADMRVEEESHASRAKIAVSVADTVCSVDLWICIQVSNTLDVYDDHLMTRTLKREMAERLKRTEEFCISINSST